LIQGLLRSLDDVAGGVEIGLADLEVNDMAALGFQSPGPHQDFKRGLRPDPRHAGG
jgi:hypothetical protein